MLNVGDKVRSTELVDKQRKSHCMGTVTVLGDGWAELKTSNTMIGPRMRVRRCDIQSVKGKR